MAHTHVHTPAEQQGMYMQTKRGKGRKGSALYSFPGVEFDQLKRVRV